MTANAQSRAYGDANPELTYVVGGRARQRRPVGGRARDDGDQSQQVGTYEITQGTLAASSNYAVTYTSDTSRSIHARSR